MGQKSKLLLGVVGGAVLVLGLVLYFQSQGILKVFPNAQDRRQARILTIDRAKFAKAEGLSDEKYEEQIQKLSELKTRVEGNRSDADAWFDFGYVKDFLNDHEGAVLAWEKAFELQPGNFVTAFNLADRYQYFLKDYEKSEFYYGKTLEIKPDFTSAYQGLGDLYQFNWKEKQNHFEPLMLEAIQNDQANKLKYYIRLTEFFSKIDLSKAQIYFAEVEKLNPEEAQKLTEGHPDLQ